MVGIEGGAPAPGTAPTLPFVAESTWDVVGGIEATPAASWRAARSLEEGVALSSPSESESPTMKPPAVFLFFAAG